MSMLRRRLLIMAATGSGIPYSPIRFIDGSIAVFCDGRTGYFPLELSAGDPIRFVDGSTAVFCDGKTGYFPLEPYPRGGGVFQ